MAVGSWQLAIGSRSLGGGLALVFLLAVVMGQGSDNFEKSPAQMPKEKGSFRKPDLVELVKLDPTIKLDVRYATANNFMKRPMYGQARAFLQRPAAEAVKRVNQKLRTHGYGLLVFDGYRPWAVTKV